MTLFRAARPHGVWLAGCLAVAAVTASAQDQSYTYVKFSLGVPWALYFVFLALVSIPFAVMILLAWRRSAREQEQEDARSDQPAHANPQARR